MALIRVTVNGKIVPPFMRKGKYAWKCELVPKYSRKICIVCAPREEANANSL